MFVCAGFWLAIIFQLIYYRFLHPSDHVRQHTKQNLASIGQLKVFPRLKKSKSCEEMISPQDQLCDTISLQLGNERWHNRFSKENRQKLISQQQAIDQRVKQTRAQKQQEKSFRPTNEEENVPLDEDPGREMILTPTKLPSIVTVTLTEKSSL